MARPERNRTAHTGRTDATGPERHLSASGRTERDSRNDRSTAAAAVADPSNDIIVFYRTYVVHLCGARRLGLGVVLRSSPAIGGGTGYVTAAAYDDTVRSRSIPIRPADGRKKGNEKRTNGRSYNALLVSRRWIGIDATPGAKGETNRSVVVAARARF